MKIAIFSDVFLEVSGGITSSIIAQKASLKSLGHEVIIFCPGWQKHKSSNNHTIVDGRVDEDVVIVPTARVLAFGGAPRSRRPKLVKAWILENYPNFADFDIIHTHYEAACSIAGMQLARQFNIPLVQTMHGREDMAIDVNIPYSMKTIIAKLLCKVHSVCIPHKIKIKKDTLLAPTIARAKMWDLMVNHANYADIVITPTEHFAEKLANYGVSKSIMVVSNGVADEIVERVEERARTHNYSLTRKLKLGEPLRIFWNSRVSHEKRIMPFLRALSKVKGNYRLVVCGDGNELKTAERFVKYHKMTDRVEFLGKVPHDRVMEQMLEQHLSATVSYGFDTQGLTLLEAEATGLPVFFCDPDMKECLPEGGALMAKGPSSKQMAKALNKLLANPEQISVMSKAMMKSRKNILQSTQITKLLKVYSAAKELRQS